MKSITMTAFIVLIGLQANATYGIKPPVTSAPNAGKISVPPTPSKKIAKPSIGIGRHEQIQFIVSSVLKEAAVKPERVKNYKKALVKIALKDKEIETWIYELNDYFNSEEYTTQSEAQKDKDRFETRMLIEMTIG